MMEKSIEHANPTETWLQNKNTTQTHTPHDQSAAKRDNDLVSPNTPSQQ